MCGMPISNLVKKKMIVDTLNFHVVSHLSAVCVRVKYAEHADFFVGFFGHLVVYHAHCDRTLYLLVYSSRKNIEIQSMVRKAHINMGIKVSFCI